MKEIRVDQNVSELEFLNKIQIDRDQINIYIVDTYCFNDVTVFIIASGTF